MSVIAFRFYEAHILHTEKLTYSCNLNRKGMSNEPRYLDVGCGYGDFLNKIREFIPNATGIEKDARIFYIFNMPIPDHIKIVDAHWGIDQKHDLIFVGWMDPGVDFRDAVVPPKLM